jgi:SAM-dependent methyltransferase
MADSIPPIEDDSSRTQFWVKRWECGKLPWDLGYVPPNLVSFLTRTGFAPARVLIPGCGTGYEVRAFHEAGYDVTAIDFSEPAVAHAREVLGPLGNKVVQGNFFKHDFSGQRFALIYERGFLCSLPTERWPDYAARMAELLLPGGRLAGLFLYGDEPEPPPFPLTEETAAALFGKSFQLVHVEPAAPDTVPVYRGLERWQEWEKIGDDSLSLNNPPA